jgi:protein TonB
MSSHRLAARPPSYPFLARTANVQGEVMLQAVISRTGSVTAVHVLDGHRLLRGAAVAAVRGWRYRPYIADGRPVSVATIVTVDFRSHP